MAGQVQVGPAVSVGHGITTETGRRSKAFIYSVVVEPR